MIRETGLQKTIQIIASILLLAAAVAAVWANDASPDALIEGNHWKRLGAFAEQKLRANPGDANANYLMALAKFQYRDYDGAQPLAEKAVALDPRNADHHYVLGIVYGRQAERANIFRQPGLAGKFKKEEEQAVALDPKHINARVALIDFHLEAPGLVGGDKKMAYKLADEILQINAARGWLAKARIARKEKQLGELESFYRKAVAADPRNYSAQIALSSFFGSDGQKKYELTEKHAREALAIAPGRADAYAQLAALFSFQQRWKELDAILVQSEQNVPDNLSAYFHAGRVLVSNNLDAARAERHLRKYLTQPPEPNAPSLAAGHLWLGRAVEKQGRVDEAVRGYQEALRLDPKLEDAKKELRRLKK